MIRDEIEARIRDHPVQGCVATMRRAFAGLAPEGPAGEKATTGGVPVRIHAPSAPGTILFLHGGGYVFGGSDTHAAAAECLARHAGTRVILPDYRLAPENPWPAPLEDACAVLDQTDGRVSVVGDSAGGHLALNLARARPGQIDRLALISPNTDRTGQSGTRVANSATDLMNSDEDDRALSRMAFGDVADDDPAASPLLADLSAVPPLYLTASTTEVLLDDSLLLARAAARAGVPVALDVVPDLFHMWTLWAAWEPANTTWRKVASHLTSSH